MDPWQLAGETRPEVFSHGSKSKTHEGNCPGYLGSPSSRYQRRPFTKKEKKKKKEFSTSLQVSRRQESYGGLIREGPASLQQTVACGSSATHWWPVAFLTHGRRPPLPTMMARLASPSSTRTGSQAIDNNSLETVSFGETLIFVGRILSIE